MLIALLTLVATAALTSALGGWSLFARVARLVAVLGALAALVIALYIEGLEGGGITGSIVQFPSWLQWLGESPFRSDALSAGLGIWCIIVGAFWLAGGPSSGEPRALAAGLLVIATLYGLAHTTDLRVFAGGMLLLLPLVWLLNAGEESDAEHSGGLQTPIPALPHTAFAFGVGALCILGAALLVGRATGGEYNLAELSLAALTRWPLALIAIGLALWLGFAPVTGWNTRELRGSAATLVQGLVVGLPVVVLVLRLEGLVSAQGLAGSVPEAWRAFASALAWAGGVTALVAGAGSIVAAGSQRRRALLTAHTMGIIALALGLDTPLSRVAAVAILVSFGAARIALDLAEGEPNAATGHYLRAISAFSLAAAPLTSGFVGLWLLATALAQSQRPSYALALLIAALLSACGIALHFATRNQKSEVRSQMPAARHSSLLTSYSPIIAGLVLLLGGVVPGLWLPQVVRMAGVAGGSADLDLTWGGLGTGGLLMAAPLLLLAALLLAAIARLVVQWARSGITPTGALLPTALSHLASRSTSDLASPLPQPSSLLWWLSLEWLEEGVRGLGVLLARLGARIGLGLGRLDGRYYLPMALILALITLLAATR
jgi:formate hydrogenlyase subunit 3/multisubunit Na+/H+ antiporter MnhD subunit